MPVSVLGGASIKIRMPELLDQSMFTKDTAYALALGSGLCVLLILVATPICIWIASVDSCERMMCEILIMRRPHADVSYCEDWFDLFR